MTGFDAPDGFDAALRRIDFADTAVDVATCDPADAATYDPSKCNPLGTDVVVDLSLNNPSALSISPLGKLCFTLKLCPDDLQVDRPSSLGPPPPLGPAAAARCQREGRFVARIFTATPLAIGRGMNVISAGGPFNPPIKDPLAASRDDRSSLRSQNVLAWNGERPGSWI